MAYLLALAVGVGSLGLYMSAFFFPEIYRRYDLVWSGIGLFYALALWGYAGQLQGILLLSQAAAAALLGWFLWQNLELRRQLVPLEQRTPQGDAKRSLSAEVGKQVGQLMNRLSNRADKVQAQLSSDEPKQDQ
ncbi:MAG: Ycf66 family protein [Elainellaceae cyanobacterium]